jgi:hypothetical protein
MKAIIFIFILFISTESANAQSGSKQHRQFAKANVDTVLSFIVEKNGKEALLYDDGTMLHYAFIDTAHNVEFSYPIETDEETPGFIFDTTKNTISVTFANKSASYQVYEGRNIVGVNVTTGGVLYEQMGVLKTKKGSLKDLMKIKLENVIIR